MEDPIVTFTHWLEVAKEHGGIAEPTAMCLATADKEGRPSARIVLLKKHDHRGFMFFTNLESRKSRELQENPHAALCFHWMPLEKQVRIEGRIQPVSNAEADSYFAGRPRESQIGAWSSLQSSPLPHRQVFLDALEGNRQKFEGKEVPRPDFWSGWLLVPERIEFWKQVEFRLHERELFTREGNSWRSQLLYP